MVQLANFRYAVRRFLRFSEEAAAEVGLTPQQHQALLAIEGFPSRNYVTITELAERLQLRHHSVIGLANRLGKLGLLLREGDATDKRLVILRLSPAGKAILARLSAIHKRHLQTVGPEFEHLLSSLGVNDESQKRR